jgi:DNA transformation protein
MEKLSDLPNIGKELERQLNNIGIITPDDLRRTGSCMAFQQIFEIDSSACCNMLYALEGALQGIRWHTLDSGKKNELKHYMKMLRLSEKK